VILEVLAEAEDEIEQARIYYNAQSPGLGGRFLADVNERLKAIDQSPLRFSKVETLSGDHTYRRARLRVFHYAVIFEIIDSTIVVVAVTHTSRKPNYWLDRQR